MVPAAIPIFAPPQWYIIVTEDPQLLHTERVAMDDERGLSAQLVDDGAASSSAEGRSRNDGVGMSTHAMKGAPDKRWQVIQ